MSEPAICRPPEPLSRAYPAPAPLEGEEVRRLVALGFHGLLNGKPAAALKLFRALAALRPEAGFPCIGQALALLACGLAREATRVLEDALASRPDCDELRVFLGVTLHVGQRAHHARTVLATVTERGADSPAARLAQRLCGPLQSLAPEHDMTLASR